MSSAPVSSDPKTKSSAIQDEIEHLEQQLRAAKLRLHRYEGCVMPAVSLAPNHDYLHALLLLSDSALPLGAFAYSSGFESYLAHHPKSRTAESPVTQLSRFLSLSLASITSTTVPYMIAGYCSPADLFDLDNDLDASTPCTVARRASVKQGLALLAVWDRSFRSQHLGGRKVGGHGATAAEALTAFSLSLKSAAVHNHDDTSSLSIFGPNGHLPPLFGTLCAALSIPLEQTLYLYLLNHSKTVISAAIRSGVLGPYQAQSMLAGEVLRQQIWAIVDQEMRNGAAAMVKWVGEEDPGNAKAATALAGQTVPVLDLWGGRHEIIYSRIFNS